MFPCVTYLKKETAAYKLAELAKGSVKLEKLYTKNKTCNYIFELASASCHALTSEDLL